MIVILKPSIDDEAYPGNPVLRGVIAPESLPGLLIDKSYQREFLSSGTRRNIMAALMAHQRVPDIELGMRGETWDSSGGEVVEVIHLYDPVYIIDGQQRRGTIIEYMDRFPDETFRLGALIHFNSTRDWERDRFHALNQYQTRVTPGVLLANARDENMGIATLYGLSMSEREFPLFNRVCWGQTMHAGDLLSAATYVTSSLVAHSHLTAVASNSKRITISAAALVERIGISVFRDNVRTLWNAIDEAWGVRSVTRRGAPWLRGGLLIAFSRVISSHTDFWNKERMVISHDTRQKLKKFDLSDKDVERLCGSSGQALVLLELLIIKHINSFRRTGRLTPRNAATKAEEDVRPPAVVRQMW